jgi:glycerophosphoryl diester phosphodiesterase
MAMISAHRCGAGSDRDLENTRAALDRALTLDVDYVEFDVQRLGDGTFVLFHDDFVMLDGRSVLMADLTFEQFSGIADHFMRYDDVLAALKGVKAAHIDLKFVSPPDAYAQPETTYEVAATRQALEILGPGQFIITTLEDRSVRAVRDWSTDTGIDLLVGLSLGRDTSEMSVVDALRTRFSEFFPGPRIRDSRANLVVCHQRIARYTVARFARRRGLPLLVWTVDEPDALTYWLAQDVSWLVTTNYPERAIELRQTVQGQTA